MTRVFLMGLFAREGINIFVSSLIHEMEDPVSNIMFMSVPSTFPCTYEVKSLLTALSIDTVFVKGIVLSRLPLISVTHTSGASREVADERPTSPANGRFPAGTCPELHSPC